MDAEGFGDGGRRTVMMLMKEEGEVGRVRQLEAERGTS